MSARQGERPVLFEWDENKRRLVLERHGIDFEDAIQIFAGPVWETLSPRTGEQRWLAIGVVGGIEIAVVYTLRKDCRRIITARRARTYERREYHAHVARGSNPP